MVDMDGRDQDSLDRVSIPSTISKLSTSLLFTTSKAQNRSFDIGL